MLWPEEKQLGHRQWAGQQAIDLGLSWAGTAFQAVTPVAQG